MTDPKRLLLAEASQEERELLAAGAMEEPPADGARRLTLALGLGAGFDAGAAPRAEGQGAAQAKLWSAKLGFKASALLLGAGGALALVLATRAPRSEPVHGAAKAPSAPAASAPAAPSPTESVPPPGEAPAVSIADEVARLDAARARLAAKDSAGALTELDAYARRYPHGTLLPEGARLRVEAVLAEGDRGHAEALVRAFLRAYPESPHAPAMRSVLARTRRAAHEE